MKEMKYLSRIADKTLDLRLEAFGAVQIAGPKWCGKTTTAERRAASFINLTSSSCHPKNSHRIISRFSDASLSAWFY